MRDILYGLKLFGAAKQACALEDGILEPFNEIALENALLMHPIPAKGFGPKEFGMLD